MTGSEVKVAVVGAGPSGLILARLLSMNHISVTVFERDANPNSRSQGGSLDFHPDSGQLAMKKAGLWDEFQRHARYEDEDFVLADRHGHVHVEIRDQQTGRPEIDRVKLREILINSLPDGLIRWGSDVRSVEPGTVHLNSGSESGFDLIVGADGAWSKVRPLLTTVHPFFSGVAGYDMRIGDIDARHPDLARVLGKGSYFIFGEAERKTLQCQRNGDGSMRVYAFMRKPESWAKEVSQKYEGNAGDARQALLDEYTDWAPQYRHIIQNTDNDMVPRSLYMLPPGLRWESEPGLTVIGDAAHLMTPFTGGGVNVAVTDAAMLAEKIVENRPDVAKAVREYEAWMFKVAQEFTSLTWSATLDRFQTGGIAKIKTRIMSMMGKRDNFPLGHTDETVSTGP